MRGSPDFRRRGPSNATPTCPVPPRAVDSVSFQAPFPRPAGRRFRMDEQLLTEKLIGYDTSTAEGIKQCAGFVKGWLDARTLAPRQINSRGLPVTLAEVGPADAETTLLLHGHIDVVPGRPEQFEPRADG